MKIEIVLEALREDYDWGEVFGEGTGRNCTQDVESLDGTSTDTVLRKDVAEIIAAVNGENDGDEWVGVFRMNDGRFLAAVGSCDYTGWDCQAGNTLTVAASLEVLIKTGLTPEQCKRLGIDHPASSGVE
jgi:hypothetical protein